MNKKSQSRLFATLLIILLLILFATIIFFLSEMLKSSPSSAGNNTGLVLEQSFIPDIDKPTLVLYDSPDDNGKKKKNNGDDDDDDQECELDADCGLGEICLDDECVEGDCHTDSDCALDTVTAPYCINNSRYYNSIDNFCGTNNFCGSTSTPNLIGVCDNFCLEGACVGCITDNDCESGQVCNNNTCEDKPVEPDCINDTDCPDGVCVEGECVDCRGDLDCASGEVCVNNECVEEFICNDGDDGCNFFNYLLCENNVWSNLGITLHKCGVDCIIPADCPTGQTCINHICEPETICNNGESSCSIFEFLLCENNVWTNLGITLNKCGVECTFADDCGQDGYVGQPSCSNNDIYQDYKEYSCGTYACSLTTYSKLKQSCNIDEYCDSGECKQCEAYQSFEQLRQENGKTDITIIKDGTLVIKGIVNDDLQLTIEKVEGGEQVIFSYDMWDRSSAPADCKSNDDLCIYDRQGSQIYKTKLTTGVSPVLGKPLGDEFTVEVKAGDTIKIETDPADPYWNIGLELWDALCLA